MTIDVVEPGALYVERLNQLDLRIGKVVRYGTGGGTNDRRDCPRYVRLMETGQLDMRTLAAATYPLDKTREAYQAAADRTVVATIVAPTT